MKNQLVRLLGLAALLSFCLTVALAQTSETIFVDPSAPAHPFPHFWEQMFGSGRAILSLRDSYRDDLRTVKQITGFDYVRFHGIFNDDVGLYDERQRRRAKPTSTTSPTSIRSTTACSPTASAPLSNSASCRRRPRDQRDAARLLVQAERLPAEGLRASGTP